LRAIGIFNRNKPEIPKKTGTLQEAGMGTTLSSQAIMPAPTSHAPSVPRPLPVDSSQASQGAITPPLLDPITRKRMKLDSPDDDHLLRLFGGNKIKAEFRNVFVTIPKQIFHGLRGDNRFTYSNFLNVAQLPYYLGGAFLAASFAAGRDKVNFARQLTGVLLYYLGVGVANKSIDTLYRVKSGVDMDLRYQKPNGDTDKVCASPKFPRFDLLEDKDYEHQIHKMGIPPTVADPKQEVQEQIRQTVSDARTDKLLLGNLLAALGAGYIARSAPLARLVDAGPVLKKEWEGWSPRQFRQLPARLEGSWLSLKNLLKPMWDEKIVGHADELRPVWRKTLLGSMAILSGLLFWHAASTKSGVHRNYESPLTDRLSPALASEKSPGLKRRPGFSPFEQAEAESGLSGGGIIR
jgi:hypothetical protein